MSIETFDQSKMAKKHAVSFTAGEQQLIMEFYEDYKTIITKKGNITIINKARDAAWESIAERINAQVSPIAQSVLQYMCFASPR